MSRVYGLNAVAELVDAAPGAIARLLYSDRSDAAVTKLIDHARAAGIQVEEVPPDRLRKRSGGRGGASIGADLRPAPSLDLAEIKGDHGSSPLVVVLDQVTDPHNLGAVMRSAAAFGADCVITSKDRSAPLNDAAVRSSAGAVAYLPLIRVTNVARTLRQLSGQGLWSCGLAGEASEILWDVDLTAPTVLVLGAEGRGLRHGVRKACDRLARWPMQGQVRSLNVSVTAGIALAEAARQRLR